MRRGIPAIAVAVVLWAAGTGTGVPDMPVRGDIRDAISAGDALVSAGADTPVRDEAVPEGYVLWKTVSARVTAYEPSRRSCGRFADGKTSLGGNAWKLNGVAACPKAIPYGTLVHIPGVGFRTVDDTGGQMRKSWRRGIYHVDLRMTYIYQARRWGNRHLTIKLYKKSA